MRSKVVMSLFLSDETLANFGTWHLRLGKDLDESLKENHNLESTMASVHVEIETVKADIGTMNTSLNRVRDLIVELKSRIEASRNELEKAKMAETKWRNLLSAWVRCSSLSELAIDTLYNTLYDCTRSESIWIVLLVCVGGCMCACA